MQEQDQKGGQDAAEAHSRSTALSADGMRLVVHGLPRNRGHIASVTAAQRIGDGGEVGWNRGEHRRISIGATLRRTEGGWDALL